MKVSKIAILTFVIVLLLSCTGCTQESNQANNNQSQTKETAETPQQQFENQKVEEEMNTFNIYANGHTLAVEAANNSSAQALLDLLKEGDIVVNAHDYGNFEKVGSLPTSLPTNDEQITTQPGDVILYQGNQLTVYYDTNSWSFTRLGKITNVNATELKEILGSDNVKLRLSLK